MKKTRTGYEILQATIAEMSADPAEFDIPIDATKVKGILERDKDPRFVTLQVAREGVSVNGRNYSADVITSIAEQINTNNPVGGAGHIKQGDESHAFPATETIWLGAVVKEMKDGKKAVYAKGYIMPDAVNRRNYLQLMKDFGKNVAVSIWGKAKEAVYDTNLQAYDIRGLNLKRIDWVPPDSEGIANDGTLILTSEMAGNTSKPKESKMDKEAVLKDTNISEMTQHNPGLVEKIQAKSPAVAEMKQVREVLGIKDTDKADISIAEMKQKIRNHELADELHARVKVPQARPVIKQMVISEMKDDETVSATVERVLKSDDAKAIISSKSGAPNLSPNNDSKRQTTARKFTNITK